MDAVAKVAGLSIWSDEVEPEPFGEGLTNRNFLVVDGGRKYVVRVGQDILVHQIMRFNKLAASRAAHAAGLSPAVVHAEPGILVLEHIEAETLTEAMVREPARLERILPVVRDCHVEVARHLRGPALIFWVFHVLRDYAGTIQDGASEHHGKLPGLMQAAEELERAVGPIDVVFGHNDLLAANFLDDGDKIWLIDWDYAGFNSPLFDLGGLASNSELDEDAERWMLDTYFQWSVEPERWRRYRAMKCASLLRETMWSMVSELHSELDYDYGPYTVSNLERFEKALEEFRALP